MSSPAVVILTEPRHCEPVEANTLVQALLQVQQLSEAGVPVSQAFCDHPAEAMKFMDAYTKAYPELQMQSSGLPLPEQLYAMLSEGRLSPLQAPDATRDNLKLEEAARLQPLYVLSLGAPEALMQALQDNGFGNNGIRVLEVAPIEDLSADSVSVAEAVAARSPAMPSWLAQSSASAQMDDEESLEASANAPLKLESVELDLDDIQIDDDDARAQRSEPAGAVVEMNPATPAVDDGDAEPADAPAEDDQPVADRPSQPTSSAGAREEPASETRESARTEAKVADPSPNQADDPDDSRPTPPGELAGEDAENPAPPTGASAEGQDQPSEEANPSGEPGLVAPEAGPDNPDKAGDPNTTGRPRHDTTGEAHAFSDPRADVLYPSNGFASDDDDLLYPLPTDGVLEAGTLEHVLGLSVVDEDVDLEAIGRHLSGAIDDPAPRLAPLDPMLTRPPGSGSVGADSFPGQDPHTDSVEPDDGAEHKPIAIVHDLDI